MRSVYISDSWVVFLSWLNRESNAYLRRSIRRTKPYHVDAQVFEMVECANDTANVTNTVAIGVLVGRRPYLVDSHILPPMLLM